MQPKFSDWLNRKPSGPKPKKRLRTASVKRAEQLRQYMKQRADYLAAHPNCEAYWSIWPNAPKCPPSTQIHHKHGRGIYLLDESTWCAISREAHWWIHRHPSEARKLGLLV